MDIPADDVIAELLGTLNIGQYALLVAAIRQAGGEIRIVPSDFSALFMEERRPRMEVMSGDGPIVLRVLPSLPQAFSLESPGE